MTVKEFENILANLDSVGLEQIDSLKFMNRTDTKFVFPVHTFTQLFEKLDPSYQVLEIKNKKIFKYHNIYFDTPDFKLFTAHQNGKLNRYKIRYREYVDTDNAFLEVKQKSNKNKTLKSRIKYNFNNKFDLKGSEFISEKTPFTIEDLRPALITSFYRVTLVNYKYKERITLDLKLTYSNGDKAESVELPYLGIAEVKSEGNGNKSNFIKYLKSFGIYPTGMSKYCIGICMMNLNNKTNRFKQKLLNLGKIKNNYNDSEKYIA